jgi:nitrogen fixation/metabolism regulation signal transduction histidine kinase
MNLLDTHVLGIREQKKKKVGIRLTGKILSFFSVSSAICWFFLKQFFSFFVNFGNEKV